MGRHFHGLQRQKDRLCGFIKAITIFHFKGVARVGPVVKFEIILSLRRLSFELFDYPTTIKTRTVEGARLAHLNFKVAAHLITFIYLEPKTAHFPFMLVTNTVHMMLMLMRAYTQCTGHQVRLNNTSGSFGKQGIRDSVLGRVERKTPCLGQ